MTLLRRYKPLAASAGTRIPSAVRSAVRSRDGGCVGPQAGLPGDCAGSPQLDHVRASHAMGRKSEGIETNLVTLCGQHHRWKTEHGRQARPLLLAYLGEMEDTE